MVAYSIDLDLNAYASPQLQDTDLPCSRYRKRKCGQRSIEYIASTRS